MVTEKQMIITERPLVLNNGKTYTLRRPTLAVRRKYLDYMDKANAFTVHAKHVAEMTVGDDEQSLQQAVDSVAEVRQQSSKMLEELVGLLVFWLKITHPDITEDEIWANFDDTDAARVQALIQNFEAEIEAAYPPANRAQRRARKPTSQKSIAVL